jgi:hypothetical protein
MIGELTVDGQVHYSTPPVSLGESLKTRTGFIPPQTNYKYTENNIVAGQYQAIGLDMQGVSPAQLEALQAKLEATQTQLEANNTESLTKHDVVGNILQAGVQGYMAMTYATDRIAAQSSGVAYYRQPGYGTFSTQMEVSYLITGTPHQVSFTGVVMDIDRLNNNVEEKANCYEGWVAFNRASGMRNSAYEHQIPEQLFSTETEQAEGVSTAKALALAMAQGQRIYTLSSENASQLNNITIDDGARAEIQQALVQGLEVTVHQAPITVNGWQGSGYAILDAEYGVGAYKISGGGSGGEVVLEVLQSLFGILGFTVDVADIVNNVQGGPFGSLLEALGKIFTFLSFVGGILDIVSNENCNLGDARYLVLVQTFMSVAFIGLAIGAGALAIPVLYAFLILWAAAFAASQVLSGLTNVVCRPSD